MPTYDALDFDPPAPVARVTLRNLHTGAIVSDVPLLMDTGVTCSAYRLRRQPAPEHTSCHGMPVVLGP